MMSIRRIITSVNRDARFYRVAGNRAAIAAAGRRSAPTHSDHGAQGARSTARSVRGGRRCQGEIRIVRGREREHRRAAVGAWPAFRRARGHTRPPDTASAGTGVVHPHPAENRAVFAVETPAAARESVEGQRGRSAAAPAAAAVFLAALALAWRVRRIRRQARSRSPRGRGAGEQARARRALRPSPPARCSASRVPSGFASLRR